MISPAAEEIRFCDFCATASKCWAFVRFISVYVRLTCTSLFLFVLDRFCGIMKVQFFDISVEQGKSKNTIEIAKGQSQRTCEQLYTKNIPFATKYKIRYSVAIRNHVRICDWSQWEIKGCKPNIFKHGSRQLTDKWMSFLWLQNSVLERPPDSFGVCSKLSRTLEWSL